MARRLLVAACLLLLSAPASRAETPAPDAMAAASVSVAGNVAGHIKTIKTTQLLTVEDSLELMRRAGALGPGPAPTAGKQRSCE